MSANVVDSSGWLEYFSEGAGGRRFAAPIADVPNLIVPTISIYEVYRRVAQLAGDDSAAQAAQIMSRGQLVDLDVDLAIAAAMLAADHRLPLADSVILATARRHGATLWTQDADFEGLDNVRYVAKLV